jgi:hypothetical protein
VEESTLLSKVSRGSRGPATTSSTSTTAVPKGEKKFQEVVQIMRPKKRANGPNPLSNIKANEDSHSAKKKKLNKFRK